MLHHPKSETTTPRMRQVEAPGTPIGVRLLLWQTRAVALARWHAAPETVRRAYWQPPNGRPQGRN